MPGYNQKTIANNVLTANNVVIMLGDIAVAFGQTTGHQYAFGTEGLYGIGSAKPQEIQQLRVSPAFTVDSFTLTDEGLVVLGGGQRLEYILAGKSFEMHVVNGAGNNTMFSYVGAKAQNTAQNIPANAPIRTTFAFLALDVLDNQGNSIIDDGLNALSIAGAAAGAGLAVSNLGLQV